MLGEANELLLTPEMTLKENLTLQPVLDLTEEFYARLTNLAIEVVMNDS